MQDLCAKLVKSGTSTPPQRMDRECGGVEEEVPFTSTSNKQPGTEPVNSACVSEGQGVAMDAFAGYGRSVHVVTLRGVRGCMS